MREQFEALIIKTSYLLFCIGLLICCSGSSDSNTRSDDENPIDENPIGEMELTDLYPPTLFTVIGDVPYNDDQRTGLIALIDAHNVKAKSEFVVHIGDIKPGSEPCEERIFEDVNGLLKNLKTPTFVCYQKAKVQKNR